MEKDRFFRNLLIIAKPDVFIELIKCGAGDISISKREARIGNGYSLSFEDLRAEIILKQYPWGFKSSSVLPIDVALAEKGLSYEESYDYSDEQPKTIEKDVLFKACSRLKRMAKDTELGEFIFGLTLSKYDEERGTSS